MFIIQKIMTLQGDATYMATNLPSEHVVTKTALLLALNLPSLLEVCAVME